MDGHDRAAGGDGKVTRRVRGYVAWFALAVMLALAAPTASSAQPCADDDIRCSNDMITWTGGAQVFDDLGFDTGFVPAGSPVQLRAALSVASETSVQMSGLARGIWPDPIEVSLTGDGGMGQLDMNFGLIFAVELKLDIDLGALGSIDRTFPIPVGLPSDLAFQGTTAFDPLLLPGQPGRPVSLTDTTSRIEVASFGFPTGVPGLTLGGTLDIRGRLTTTYQTDNMLVDAVSVTSETETVLVDPPNSGYGAAAEFPTRPVGHFDYDLEVELIPAFFVEFFTFELLSIDLGQFAFQAAQSSGNATFAPVLAHLPVPDVRVLESEFVFPETLVGMTSVVRATFRNFGEQTLYVDLTTLPAPFSASRDELVIDPSGFARVDLIFSPTAPGEVSATGMVETNDPDAPFVLLDLRGVATVPGMPDLGVLADGGMASPDGAVIVLPDGAVVDPRATGGISGGACGCRVPAARDAGGHLPLVFAFGLVVSLAWRRRR